MEDTSRRTGIAIVGIVAYLLFLFPCVCAFSAEENFLLMNGLSRKVVSELGPHINERVTPCSTFKIALSLMGYDASILKDDTIPTWDFQEGYDDYSESWRAPQTPQSWMKHGCVWYSRLLATQLGGENIQNYLALLEYGNQDMSGGLNRAWLSSSLKISPKEQVDLIQRMIQVKLPLSINAVQLTKDLLFVEELADGWKLFGKTGWGCLNKTLEIGWFVGWVEKGPIFFPFAYNIREHTIDLPQRIPRVKELLATSLLHHPIIDPLSPHK